MQSEVIILIGSSYDLSNGWEWHLEPINKYPFASTAAAKEYFNFKLNELPLLANEYNTGIKISVQNTDGQLLQDPVIYDGENVLDWYAAYNVKFPLKKGKVSFKRFIDKILLNIPYYAFLKRYGTGENVYLSAIAPTIEEVIDLLGTEAKNYPVAS